MVKKNNTTLQHDGAIVIWSNCDLYSNLAVWQWPVKHVDHHQSSDGEETKKSDGNSHMSDAATVILRGKATF